MAYVLGTSFLVDSIVAGSNITISPTEGRGNVTINGLGSAPGVSTGVLSLAYTTGITGSGSNGNITLSNTGVRSIVAGTGISVNTATGQVTVTNTNASGIPSLVAGSNISLTNTSTISVLADPRFTTSMGFSGSGTTSVFTNVAYPYGSPTQYYPYVTNAGTDVLNTVGGRQFWATLTSGSTNAQVMRYRYDGIEAQQGTTGTTIPFLTFNNSTGLFGLSNTSNVVNSNIAGTGISVSGATGSVTITNTGVTSLVAGSGVSLSGSNGAVTITNTSTGGIYGTGVLITDTVLYNSTDYVYWSGIADNSNVTVDVDTRIITPTQSGIYHITWNINVLAAFIGGGSNFVITTKPGVFDTFGITFTGKYGGTCDTSTYTGNTITDIICVSGMTQISIDRTTDRGFAIQFFINTVTPAVPAPAIPLIAITNDSGALNYTQATITIHKIGDLPPVPP